MVRSRFAAAVASSFLFSSAFAQSSSAATATTGGPPASSTTVATATPSTTAPLDATLPQQAPLPPKQAWCPSDIFCAGSLLQTLNIARVYPDSKTIVDKPTVFTSAKTLQDFQDIVTTAGGLGNVTYRQIIQFEETDFKGEGLELAPLDLPNFPQAPKFLSAISDPLVKAFALEVHKIWDLLIRQTNPATLCPRGANATCESSLIPLNHTFVVPGGRFREQYYWDSFWILEGLLESELYDVARSTLENFMDELENFGFIPNGGRVYYLNRSQPPVFIPMLYRYVQASKDQSILTRALPLAEAELTWWETKRTLKVKSPYTKKTYSLAHYAVNNSAPRPESYFEDYQAANGADIEVPFTDAQKAALYAELASGAETGWDYSSRWIKQPSLGNLTYNTPALRTLNVRDTLAVDLNSILYKARKELALLYDLQDKDKRNGGGKPSSRAQHHRDVAASIKEGVLDLFWDKRKLAFYDFNLTANARGTAFTAAHFYPLWSGIIPNEIANDENKAFGAFSSINFVLNRYNGTFPATFLETGLQWDFPNSWPPHIYIALQALLNLPSRVTKKPIPNVTASRNSFSYIPAGQLGFTESELPAQIIGNGTAPPGVDINALPGTVVNGGVAKKGENWAHALKRELANRYVTSIFCGWYGTGGAIPNILPRLPDEALNVTQSIGQNGHLFEKFSALDVDSAGRGGEYAVQSGFGWSNGALLWIVAKFGADIATPTCPPLL